EESVSPGFLRERQEPMMAGYFFLGADLAAAACFFFSATLLALDCFWEDFFWLDLGFLSPISFNFLLRVDYPRHV
ncbi:MAG: hypothetical protein ACXWIU_13275, partial [Limisphaerales bacterium]